MSSRPSIVALLGYDRRIVAGMSARHRRHLSAVAASALVPCALVGGAAAQGIWLVEGSFPLAVGLGLGFALAILNLLRVAVAGGGAAPHLTRGEALEWRPRLTPMVLMTFLGVFFAQPAQIPLHAAALDPEIEAYRAELVEAHGRAILGPLEARISELASERGRVEARLEDPRGASRVVLRGDLERIDARIETARAGVQEAHDTDLAVYARHMAETAFAVRRVQLLWREPRVPALLTGVFTLLVLLPLALARGPRLTAVRTYEVERWRRHRAAVRERDRRVRARVHALLSRWPTYTGELGEGFEDEWGAEVDA